MTLQEPTESIEEKHFKISVRVAVTVLVFWFVTVAAGAAWAQNVNNHMANLDSTLMEVKDVLKEIRALNVLQERTQRMDERL